MPVFTTDHPPSPTAPAAASRLRRVLLCLLIITLTLTTLGASRQHANDPTAVLPMRDVAVRGEAASTPIGLTLLRNAPTTSTTAPPPPPTTEAPPPPQPAPKAAPAAAPRQGADPNDPATWDRLARCEAGGNWAANTGNGYYGGLQFSLSSWRGVGGTGYPHENSRETQIEMGKRLQRSSGWGAWPSCSRQLGYR